jgi:hypothetical protein
MQILGKVSLLFVVVCYISTAYGKEKTVRDTVVDTVSDGVKTAKDGVKVGAKHASDAAKTAG